MERKDFGKAVEICEDFLGKFPNDSRVVLLMAKILEESGDQEKSLDIYDQYSGVFKDKKDFVSRLASSTIESFQNDIEELIPRSSSLPPKLCDAICDLVPPHAEYTERLS